MKDYIIVTGASGNFGNIVARTLAERGKNLILMSRRGSQDIVSSYPDVDIIDMNIDLGDSRNAYNVANSIKENYNISGVIYCSGGMDNRGDWLDTLDYNLNFNVKSYLSFVKVFIDKFVERDSGFFVSCSSVGGYGNNYDLFNLYKFPLVTVTESLNHRLSVRKSNVKVFCLPICSLVSSGETVDPMPKENIKKYAEKMLSHINENNNQPLILSDECEDSFVGNEITNIQKSMKKITEKEKQHFGWSEEVEFNYFNSSLL